ncbi:FecR domain-containing protein [uncultured Microbulbifer sp.]|uniref:FecR family protein n=1 Tax=uncultured Microbulbifer sp. TaxID=348147 RepID=UPI0025EA0123|nr:FecR domain-containing protein [uncultured Microbulbifer sp.]
MTTGNRQTATDIRQVEAAARAWFMLCSERPLTAAEQSDFDNWLQEPANRASFQRLEQIDRSLAALAAGEQGARLRQRGGIGATLERLRDLLLTPASGLAFACVMMLAVAVVYLAPSQDQGGEAYATELAETRTVTLEDGSAVVLGGDSAIESVFDGERRGVKLLRGQAFFTVTRDPSRPFYVNAEGAEIRVVGTRFDVRSSRDAKQGVKVTVEEGIVDVAPTDSRVAAGNASKVRLQAGEQVQVIRRRFGEVKTVDASQVASWRQGVFSYRDAPLSEVVADANRYRKQRIVIGTPELENLRVTTAFTVDQADTLVAMLEQSLPVRVFREPDGRMVIWPGTVEE